MLHACLVVGPPGPERLLECRRYAALLIEAGEQERLVLAGRHPDVQEYPDPLRVEHVREIGAGLARPPLLGGGRAVLLGGLALATREAQSALLRMAEEPPPDLYFVAEVESAQQILPTLRSRFGRRPLPAGTAEQVAARLREEMPEAPAELIAEASAASAGYIDAARERLTALQALDEVLPADDGREDWFVRAASAVDSLAPTWLNGLMGRMRARWAATRDVRYLRAWQRLEEARLTLERKANARLTAEVLFLELGDLGVLRHGHGGGHKVP